jgi:hypothetical protein
VEERNQDPLERMGSNTVTCIDRVDCIDNLFESSQALFLDQKCYDFILVLVRESRDDKPSHIMLMSEDPRAKPVIEDWNRLICLTSPTA